MDEESKKEMKDEQSVSNTIIEIHDINDDDTIIEISDDDSQLDEKTATSSKRDASKVKINLPSVLTNSERPNKNKCRFTPYNSIGTQTKQKRTSEASTQNELFLDLSTLRWDTTQKDTHSKKSTRDACTQYETFSN